MVRTRGVQGGLERRNDRDDGALSAAICYLGLALFQRERRARLIGIVAAFALSIASGVSAALVALPWLSAPGNTDIPRALLPAIGLLVATAAAFGGAAAALILDRGGGPTGSPERRVR